MSLPPSDDLENWITAQCDHTGRPNLSRGWRWRAVGGITIHQIMASVTTDKQLQCFVRLPEWTVLAALIRPDETLSDFMRVAIAREAVARGAAVASLPYTGRHL